MAIQAISLHHRLSLRLSYKMSRANHSSHPSTAPAAARRGGGLTIFLTEEHGTLATVCLIILARSAVVEMII